MRPIDADAMMMRVNGHGTNKYGVLHDVDIRTFINEQPTIDAVPVVHGEWTNRRTWTHDGEWYCTACDKEITIYMGEKRGNDRYKYCPNCGARMRTVTDCHTLDER